MKHTALKCVASFVLAVGMLVGCTSAFAATETPESSDAQSIGGTVQPKDKELYQGSHSGTQFTTTFTASSRDGANLNFWVKNKGTTDVVITIDGKNARTLKPGTQGHISITLGYFNQSHTCKAVPSPNGGTINIDYRIAQRDIA